MNSEEQSMKALNTALAATERALGEAPSKRREEAEKALRELTEVFTYDLDEVIRAGAKNSTAELFFTVDEYVTGGKIRRELKKEFEQEQADQTINEDYYRSGR